MQDDKKLETRTNVADTSIRHGAQSPTSNFLFVAITGLFDKQNTSAILVGIPGYSLYDVGDSSGVLVDVSDILREAHTNAFSLIHSVIL
jgi:phosphoketolase